MRAWWLLVLALPTAAAGTADEPEIRDALGDVMTDPGVPAQEPWRDVVDLEAFWVETDGVHVLFHYHIPGLADLSSAGVADLAGRSFWSYTDFVASVDGLSRMHEVYMDHNSNPAFATGWRFYFHDSQDPIEGAVDLAARQITLTILPEQLGGFGPGDVLSAFIVQASTDATGLTRSTDWAPDGGQPCRCSFQWPLPPPPPPEPVQGQEAQAVPAAGVLAALAVLAGLAWRRRSA